MQSQQDYWLTTQRREAVYEWAIGYHRKFQRQQKNHNHIYYYGCCHVFCSYKSQTMHYHQQDTKMKLAKYIRDWGKAWCVRSLVDWIYVREEEAQKAGRKLPFISYNTYHYNYPQPMIPNPPPVESEERKSTQSAPVDEEDILSKRMRPPKFCSEVGYRLDIKGQLDQNMTKMCEVDSQLSYENLHVEEMKVDMSRLVRNNKFLRDEVAELKVKLRELQARIEQSN